MTDSRKISIRLKQEDRERLQEYCAHTGQDISRVVRQALNGLIKPQSDAVAGGTVLPRRLSSPEQIAGLLSTYLGWAGGDLREELKRLFAKLLAVSYACKKLYPRTSGVLDGYEGLVQLCPLFRLDEERPTK